MLHVLVDDEEAMTFDDTPQLALTDHHKRSSRACRYHGNIHPLHTLCKALDTALAQGLMPLLQQRSSIPLHRFLQALLQAEQLLSAFDQ